MTLSPPAWTGEDRALVLALLAEERDTCSSCGHPMELCRNPSTAGKWTVVSEICQPSRVAQAVAEQVAESKARGVQISTRQS